VGSGREALDAVGAMRTDVVIIGWTLGAPSGEQVLNAVIRDGLGTRVRMIAAARAGARVRRAGRGARPGI
jgi:hypothetical protein